MDTSNTKKIKSFNFLINKGIYLFLIKLFRKILLKEKNTKRKVKADKKLEEYLREVNDKIIKNEKKKITSEYKE